MHFKTEIFKFYKIIIRKHKHIWVSSLKWSLNIQHWNSKIQKASVQINGYLIWICFLLSFFLLLYSLVNCIQSSTLQILPVNGYKCNSTDSLQKFFKHIALSCRYTIRRVSLGQPPECDVLCQELRDIEKKGWDSIWRMQLTFSWSQTQIQLTRLESWFCWGLWVEVERLSFFPLCKQSTNTS